jgi:CRISPR-associated endonuclease/helicase Cas3
MPPIEKFEEITGFEPNPMQKAMWKHVTNDDCAVLLKAPTGSGKTEAVLIPGLVKGRRMFMIFPTRSLVDDQIGRVVAALVKLSAFGKQYSLVVDTGGQSYRRLFLSGQEITSQQFNSRRHLYDGDVIITTLDKFLYRFFGFGEDRKSFIFPFRIFYGLKQSLFVFDEAHSYEDTAFTNFIRLIKALYVAHLDIVLMTATMPKSYEDEFNFLDPEPWLDTSKWLGNLKSSAKRLQFTPCKDSEIVDTVVRETQKLNTNGKRLIVTIETVENAISVWRKLDQPLLYHGRLDNEQRKKVYSELKRRESANEGYILVTTSAIEVGCDLNADYLITEICNPANLIQRAGRCNRRDDRPDAQMIVVGDTIKEFLREISIENEQAYLEKLRENSGSGFIANDFLNFTQRGVAYDYRVEMMFDMLFEYVYDGRLENKPLHEKGLVVTRSWEPSVTLTTNIESLAHSVSVPISRCAARQEKDCQKEIKVYTRYFNKFGNEYETVTKEIEYGGFAYFRDLVIEVPEDGFDETIGYIDLPKPFFHIFPDGYKERLIYPHLKDGKEQKVWLFYLRWKPEEVIEQIKDTQIDENNDNDSEDEE